MVRAKIINGGTVRCAIYTRKSSEEGLEQDFNSLDAQREACEAYIRSQKGVGWTALLGRYDDGGISGGTLERHALKRLLVDIAAGRVDTVIVYKVDRLTRSLSDFAKIVDVFDGHDVSLVSVTQQFNTTTSMGRLTLNMLLSFAQFERDVTGERIRDKIAASKQKGMWMGGRVLLGYDVQDRKLVVNALEAEIVRHIFRRYVTLKSVRALKDDLDRDNIVSKIQVDRFGRTTGGKPMSRGALYKMLHNPIYHGKIRHKDQVYPGLHDAIIDDALWNKVQAVLAENRVERVTRSKACEPSLLSELVYDANGERMSPTHANKNGTRYRYYVSQSLIKRGRTTASQCACRVPAADLEALVSETFCAMLRDEAFVSQPTTAMPIAQRKRRIDDAADLARRWSTLRPSEHRMLLYACVYRVVVGKDTVDIAVRRNAIAHVATSDPDIQTFNPIPIDGETRTLSVPARIKRTGMENRLLIHGDTRSTQSNPNPSLLRLLAQAHRFRNLLMSRSGEDIGQLATEVGVSQSYFTRVMKMGFIAPDITKTILQGRQPMDLSASKLMAIGARAPQWAEQKRQLNCD